MRIRSLPKQLSTQLHHVTYVDVLLSVSMILAVAEQQQDQAEQAVSRAQIPEWIFDGNVLQRQIAGHIVRELRSQVQVARLEETIGNRQWIPGVSILRLTDIHHDDTVSFLFQLRRTAIIDLRLRVIDDHALPRLA